MHSRQFSLQRVKYPYFFIESFGFFNSTLVASLFFIGFLPRKIFGCSVRSSNQIDLHAHKSAYYYNLIQWVRGCRWYQQACYLCISGRCCTKQLWWDLKAPSSHPTRKSVTGLPQVILCFLNPLTVFRNVAESGYSCLTCLSLGWEGDVIDVSSTWISKKKFLTKTERASNRRKEKRKVRVLVTPR